MPMNAETEKMFEYYLDLPTEVRAIILEKSESADRCRFKRCSKLCEREVNESKNFVHSLELYSYENTIRMKLLYRPSGHHPDVPQGFILEFAKEASEKYIRYTNANKQEYWRCQLDISTDLVQYVAECFKNKLNLHHNTIKNLSITKLSNVLRFEEFGDLRFDSFKNLENVYLDDSVDVRSIISKTRKPLKKLSIKENRGGRSIPYIAQVYQVRQTLVLPTDSKVKFNNEQLLRLSASIIRINIGGLTEKNVFNFIRLWQDSILRENFESCVWELYDSNFNVDHLVALLGVEKPRGDFSAFGSGIDCYDIEHNKQVGKIAKLTHCRYRPSELTFSTKLNQRLV